MEHPLDVYKRQSEDRISAFIMFCLAEVDDIGLEVPVFHTGYTDVYKRQL